MNANLTLSHYLFFAGLVGVVLVVYVVVGGARRKARLSVRDQRDPTRQWAAGVYGIITGGVDYGYQDKSAVRAALSGWWGVEDAQSFQLRFDGLIREPVATREAIAWNLVRAVNLARMAAGAKYIQHETSWGLIVPLLPWLQRRFNSWEDLGQSYRQAREQWIIERDLDRKEVEDVDRNLMRLRNTVWRRNHFQQPLA